jgi:8-oxo-dGTP diphosphatase
VSTPVPTSGVTSVAAYVVCVDDERRVLLCRVGPGEADSGRWMLPGGGLDFGEEPAAGAVRELREESGLSGEVIGLAAVESRLFPGRRRCTRRSR